MLLPGADGGQALEVLGARAARIEGTLAVPLGGSGAAVERGPRYRRGARERMTQSTDPGELNRPARTQDEIKARARMFNALDPFPHVPPALLSSAEILDYDRVTGMTGITMEQPGQAHEGHLKAASLEIFIGGEYVYWNGDKKVEKTLKDEDAFLKLPANSIVFVQTKNVFHLPQYIAMRFNLRITHVHRGLLLGTGPLVDPGFSGRLLIPLHNLTSSDYFLDTKKALIWVEFTKTSANYETARYRSSLADAGSDRTVRAIEPYKSNVSPNEYLYKAGGGHPIASSIPQAVRGARRDAKRARETAETLQAWARGFGLLAVLGAVIGITGIVNTTWNLVETAYVAVGEMKSRVVGVEAKVAADAQSRSAPSAPPAAATDNLDRRVGSLEGRVADTDALKERLASADRRIADLAQALAAAVAAEGRSSALLGELERRTSALEARVTTPGTARRPASQGRRGKPRRRRGGG